MVAGRYTTARPQARRLRQFGAFNNLTPSNQMEENAVDMTKFLLKAKQGTLNSTDTANIWTIAHYCPFYGGTAVVEARAFLMADSLELYHKDWEDSCVVPTSKKGHDLVNHIIAPEQNQYSLYPNPSTGQIHILWNGEEPVDLEIYSLLGQRVLGTTVHTGNNSISLPAERFDSGVYIVRLLQNGYTIGTEKLIINP